MIDQQKESKTLLIPAYRHIHDIHLIMRLEGKGNYTIVYLRSEPKPLLVSRTLKFFEPQLPDFIRVSKSLLLNPGYIEKIIKVNSKQLFLQLTDGVRISVSRRRIADTLARLKS